MANNHYRQQWQPRQAQPRAQYGYEQRNDQRAWQENGRNFGPYQQDPAYDQYQNGQNGYGSGSGPVRPAQYGREEQWQGDYYQEPYENHMNGAYQGQYEQDFSPNRTYQYDERYRTNGQRRPPQTNPQAYPNPQDVRERPRQELAGSEKGPKPRERILAEPTSPKTLAWDNPFGAFPPLKKRGEERNKHSSLDNGMNDLSVADRRGNSPERRPQTSHGPRRREVEGRPGTSHGNRPDPRDPPQRPEPEMYPARVPPMPDRQDFSPQQPPQIAGLPARPTAHRSKTGPVPDPGPDRAKPSPYGGPYSYDDQQGQPPPPPQPPPQQQPYYDHRRQPFQDPYAEPQTRLEERQPSEPAYGRPRNDENVNASSYRGVALGKTSSHHSADMPNFDAIPNRMNEKFENDFGVEYQPPKQPAYQKQNYQAYTPPIETREFSPVPAGANTTSPLAEFSFDLRPNRSPGGAYDNGPQSPPQTYNDQRQYDPRLQPPRGYEDGRRQQIAPSEYPPRAQSRGDVKPRTESDANRRPPPNWQNHDPRVQDQYPARPRTSHGQRAGPQAPNLANQSTAYDQGYQRSGRQDLGSNGPAPYNQDYSDPPNRPLEQNYGQSPPPRRMTPHDGYTAAPVRPMISNPSHPAPVRHYGERAGMESSRLNQPPPNPDSLPAHPVPVRPGLASASTPAPASQSSGMPVQRRETSGPGQSQPNGSGISNNSSPVTVQELNSLREAFKNNPNDHALGLKFAKKLVEAASVLSNENGRADPKQTAKNRERYIFDAHKTVKKLIGASYPEAMFYLADCYGQGLLGLEPDPKEAFHLYQSAAKLNHAQSAYRVAVCCELGLEDGGGTRRDPLKAMQWYKRAATLGDTPAMYKMGMILLKGLLGQPRNPREAVSWLKRAAEKADKDNPHALHELGLLYESATPTDHILRDEPYALQLFQQAAELGYKYSQFRLGSAYEYGLLGCLIDARQSIAWYTRAAAQGEHQSELALSGWYLTGSEPLLQQSDTEAYLWARKAASSGLAKAEYAMGYFTEVGIGAAANMEEAKRWYYRAAAQNFQKARDRLEDLKRGGQKMQKTRVSRSHVGKQNEGECIMM